LEKGCAFKAALLSLLKSTSVEKEGGIAQLGERLHGMQEVSGSIPLTSTKQSRVKAVSTLKK
jgi:hypothetical protein